MKKILIVEDNPQNMKLTAGILEKNNYTVLKAYEAETGIKLAQEENPDLILMDIQLPGLDGMTATQRLKGDPATKHIPIIALTAYAMKGDREKMLAIGCDDYISKPLSLHDFLDKVQQYTSSSSGE